MQPVQMSVTKSAFLMSGGTGACSCLLMSVRVQWKKSDDMLDVSVNKRKELFIVSASGAKNAKPYQKCRTALSPRHE